MLEVLQVLVFVRKLQIYAFIATVHMKSNPDFLFYSFGATVDFSRRPRKTPKSTIVTILIKSLL